MDRKKIIEQLKHKGSFDLLVIGGGATGCGISLDAASRGLSVLLVEQNDFAEGTSGRSSKLVHGGVRYLEMAVKHLDREQYQLVKEGLQERFYFLRNAPHLSQSLPLISPVYRWSQLPYVWLGLKLYDQLSGTHSLGPSGFSSRERTLDDFPLLQREKLKGGIRYYDGQFNDSRMALSLALTAAEHGALILNHMAVSDLSKTNGRLTGAQLEDRIDGEKYEVSAKAIVNATGPFADQLREIDDPDSTSLLSISSGIHIVLDSSYIPPKAGLLISETEDDRVLFVLPWQGRCLVGTTDQPSELLEHPLVADSDIEYLLRHLEKILDPPPTRENISACWSGLRPLVHDPKAHNSSRLLRDFIIDVSSSGLFSIVGGKWTSYRRMAEKLVDRVVVSKQFQAKPCNTYELPVHGADKWQPNGWQQLADEFGLPAENARYLHSNYGSEARKVAELAAQGYQKKFFNELPCIEAEVIYACRFELAERATDVLTRRMPLALLDSELAEQAVSKVLELMAQECQWSAERLRVEQQLAGQRLTIAL